MKFKTSRILILAFTLSLAACMSMPMTTMYKMSQLSILDIEPSEISVAIRTNESVKVETGAANIRLAMKTEGLVDDSVNRFESEQFPPFDLQYKFQIQVLPGFKSEMASILSDGIEAQEQITILKLSEEDAATMTTAMARVKSYKAKGVEVNGQFSFGIGSSCFGDLAAFDELKVDLFIQTDADDGYMLFLEDMDIIEESRDRSIELATANKCLAE
jgi:hypothetical protein